MVAIYALLRDVGCQYCEVIEPDLT